MARRKLGVIRPIGNRLRLLVRQAYPKGSRHRSETISCLELSLSDARQLGDYIRQVRAGRYQQPPPDRAWALGAAIGVLSGKRWINPITVLFACGHYGVVANLFFRVRSRAGALSELTELARTLRTVLQDRPSPRYSYVHDDLAAQEAKNWDSSFNGTERYDRRVWSLDGPTYAAFAESWHELSLASPLAARALSNAPVAACQLIADAAEYAVADRDRFVSLIIADAIPA